LSKQVLILNYHELISEEDRVQKEFDPVYAVTKENFIQQMKLIKERNIPVCSLSEVIAGTNQDVFSIAITFDDGYLSDLEVADAILQENGYSAAFFPIISFVGMQGRLNWNQLKILAGRGYNIGSHGLNHINLTGIHEEELLNELEGSKRELERQLKKEISIIAFPYGKYTKSVMNSAKNAGYRTGLSTHTKINNSESSLVLHRWNIKMSTSLEEFEMLISGNRSIRAKNAILSKVKSLVYNVSSKLKKS